MTITTMLSIMRICGRLRLKSAQRLFQTSTQSTFRIVRTSRPSRALIPRKIHYTATPSTEPLAARNLSVTLLNYIILSHYTSLLALSVSYIPDRGLSGFKPTSLRNGGLTGQGYTSILVETTLDRI